MELSEEELVVIRKALGAYVEHLGPSASHVKEISMWRDKVESACRKVSNILLSNDRRIL